MPSKGWIPPSPYNPTIYGTPYRKDYAGEGTRENPFQFYFHSGDSGLNFNSPGIAISLLGEQRMVACRIRKVRLTLDGGTAAALNITARVGAQTYYESTGTASTGPYFCDAVLFTGPQAAGSYYGDTHVWDFGPDGVLFIIGASANWHGHWNGYLYLTMSGYAATDDYFLIVEGEWWYL